ncbi:hypothetical protein [Lactiplantibacillus plantarum]|nr:hypothetical protein [Lactiplantibacillus plantarum]KZU53048.1 hypothetical protein Nizo2801_1886 [Lactiplantibacillus plantarum]WAU30937.1 hypothetical protein OR568_02566 [Lactiplantibacillus plantarum]
MTDKNLDIAISDFVIEMLKKPVAKTSPEMVAAISELVKCIKN